MCLNTVNTHKCSTSLQESAECLPSILSLKANDEAYVLFGEIVIKCVWEQLRETMERARESVWFSSTLRVLGDFSLVWKHDRVCVPHRHVRCVWTQHLLHMCVFLFVCASLKLVYHHLCSHSHSVPASVQYFFQLPPPNGGSGQFYGTTLGRLLWPDPEHLAFVDQMFYSYGHNI